MARSWQGPQQANDDPESLEESQSADDALFYPTGESWFPNPQKELATECSYCGATFGKRRMRPRHHCRICFQAVCSKCAPNFLEVDGQTGTHRTCKACAVNAQKAPAMRSRLEQVAEKIHLVCGPSSNPAFTFAGATHGDQDTAFFGNASDTVRAQTLDDAVSTCEFAVSTLMTAFNSHQSAKLKIEEVEAEIVEQRAARARLETVAQRVDEAENEAAEERQGRKQLEAKVRLAKNDCIRLAERLCSIGGSQAGLPSRTASLEDAIATIDSGVVRIEVLLEEAQRARKDLETEKQEVVVSKERQVQVLQTEIMKLRADVAHERKLRESVEDSVLHSISSKIKTSAGSSLSPRSSIVREVDSSEGDRLLYQGLKNACAGVAGTSARPPSRMNSVSEDESTGVGNNSVGNNSPNHSIRSVSDSAQLSGQPERPCCKSSCAVS